MTQTAQSAPCNNCGGSGLVNNSRGAKQICPGCGGTGSKQPPVIRVPFDYVFASIGNSSFTLTANQTGLNVVLTFDFDADFEHIWTVANSTGLWSATIIDTSVGRRQLSNAAVNGENFAGTAALPFPLVEPYVWPRSGTAQGQFNDRSGSSNTVQLVFRGYKLYPADAPMQGSQGLIVNQNQ